MLCNLKTIQNTAFIKALFVGQTKTFNNVCVKRKGSMRKCGGVDMSVRFVEETASKNNGRESSSGSEAIDRDTNGCMALDRESAGTPAVL